MGSVSKAPWSKLASMRWNTLKALPLGLGVPVVIGAMSVNPEDAGSNLAAWLKLFGLHDVPTWLANPAIDTYGIYFAIIFGIIYALFVWPIPSIRKWYVAQQPIVSDGRASHRSVGQRIVDEHMFHLGADLEERFRKIRPWWKKILNH